MMCIELPLCANQHLMTSCVAATTRTTFLLYSHKEAGESKDLTPNQQLGNLARKWRAERNFWIAFFTFTLWWYARLVFTPDLVRASCSQRPIAPCTHHWLLRCSSVFAEGCKFFIGASTLTVGKLEVCFALQLPGPLP